MIIFRPKNEEITAEHPEFNLTLSKKQNYDVVCEPQLSLSTSNSCAFVDVYESRRISQARADQIAFYYNASFEWSGQICAQALSESEHIGDNGSQLYQPNDDGHSLREAGRQHCRAGDEAKPQNHMDRHPQQRGSGIPLSSAEDKHGT